jgi:hypothetical protein
MREKGLEMATVAGVGNSAALAEVLGSAWDSGSGEGSGDTSATRASAVRELTQRWLDLRTVAVADAPVRSVVFNQADGTIAARFDEHRGVVLGDDRPFPWDCLRGPLTLLWHPDDIATVR